MFHRCCALVVLLAGLTTSGPLWAAVPPGEVHVYKEVDGRQLKLYVNKPADWQASDRRPAVVFFHGGGWVGGAPGQFTEHCKHLVSRGMVTVQVEYRLLDRKSNDPPTTCVQDATDAMCWVRRLGDTLGIDPDRIASGGGSAGGHLAAYVGTIATKEPQGVQPVSAKSNAMLLFNPVYENGPQGWGHQRVGERYREFSPFHNVSSDDPPSIVFLGSQDKLIPVATAEAFQQAMQEAGVRSELHIYEGQPHGFFNVSKSDGEYFRQTLAETDRFLTSLGWLEEPTEEKNQ